MKHIPVLLNEVLNEAKNTEREVKTILDATFGRGGHASALREVFPQAFLIGLDQDEDAISYAEEHFKEWKNFKIVRGNFHQIKDLKASEMDSHIHSQLFDLILIDLGVSSPQLDESHRGFSFYNDGPLDMRMDQRRSLTAKDIINTWPADDLIQLFQDLGEVRRPHKIVEKILEDRDETPFETTRQLASLIERVEGWRKKGFHPATQYFLALRLEVNSELDGLDQALVDLIQSLNPGGRLLVISFHSLEDRIVKNIFKNSPELGSPVHKKVIQAEWAEKKSNPRARSAKLRVFEKGPVE